MKKSEENKSENVDVHDITQKISKDLQKALTWTESQRKRFFEDLENLAKIDENAAEELANKYIALNENLFNETERIANELNSRKR